MWRGSGLQGSRGAEAQCRIRPLSVPDLLPRMRRAQCWGSVPGGGRGPSGSVAPSRPGTHGQGWEAVRALAGAAWACESNPAGGKLYPAPSLSPLRQVLYMQGTGAGFSQQGGGTGGSWLGEMGAGGRCWGVSDMGGAGDAGGGSLSL